LASCALRSRNNIRRQTISGCAHRYRIGAALNFRELRHYELRRNPIRRSSVAFVRHSSPVSKTTQRVEKAGGELMATTNRARNAQKRRVWCPISACLAHRNRPPSFSLAGRGRRAWALLLLRTTIAKYALLFSNSNRFLYTAMGTSSRRTSRGTRWSW
jgi:hypothetical protein